MVDQGGERAEEIGSVAYRALYENSPDGVLFTVPDGRVLAANPAACHILGRTEAEICSLGRQGLADVTDERWPQVLAERARAGHARGVARMLRADGTSIEVEMSATGCSISTESPGTSSIQASGPVWTTVFIPRTAGGYLRRCNRRSRRSS